MEAPSPSQIEALTTPALSLMAGGGTQLPCPLRAEHLKLVTFLDNCINRPETTLQLRGPTASRRLVVALTFASIDTTSASSADELASSRLCNSFVEDVDCEDILDGDDDDSEAGERGDDSGEALAAVDGGIVATYLAALFARDSSATAPTRVCRAHAPIVDGRPPSAELLGGLLLQTALRHGISRDDDAVVIVVPVATDGGSLPTVQVCEAVQTLARDVLRPSASIFVVSSGAAGLTGDAALMLLRRFSAVLMAQFDVDPLASSRSRSPLEVLVHVTTGNCATIALASLIGHALHDLSSEHRYWGALLQTNDSSLDLGVPFRVESSTSAVGAIRDAPLTLSLAASIIQWRAVVSKTEGDKTALPMCPGPVGLLRDDPVIRGEAERALLDAVPLLTTSDLTSVRDVQRLLAAIRPTGVAILLRCRLTPGSITAIDRGVVPVARSALLAAFRVPHEAGQVLTVGARALAKHIHRDETESWWGGGGELKGTQAAKNAQAETVIARVLDGAVWCNVHMLPHDIVTLEYRVAAGYGARWCYSLAVDAGASGGGVGSMQFRGFLEPVDPEGHEKGWRH